MEASYQKYRGRVNFLWVYGSEAHPEEYPFATGFESSDLGWNHPYSISTKMDERAQRAKWMKTDPDPDFELPMIIDYINHPTATNNAIRAEYRGGGFYSGYVIDCDGTVLKAHNWAWFAPGGEWWNLPLTPISDLHQFLDGYLASPPACYGSTTMPSTDGGMSSSVPDSTTDVIFDGGAAGEHDDAALSTPPTLPENTGCTIGNDTHAADIQSPWPLLAMTFLGLILSRRHRPKRPPE